MSDAVRLPESSSCDDDTLRVADGIADALSETERDVVTVSEVVRDRVTESAFDALAVTLRRTDGESETERAAVIDGELDIECDRDDSGETDLERLWEFEADER